MYMYVLTVHINPIIGREIFLELDLRDGVLLLRNKEIAQYLYSERAFCIDTANKVKYRTFLTNEGQ